jgi:hypothetical protein
MAEARNGLQMDELYIGCLGLIASIIFSTLAAIVSVVGLVFAYQANNAADSANQLSLTAIQSANNNAAADRKQQADIARFEQYVKRPSLATLRFDRLSDSEFRATIQNTGERQAALFELEFVFQDVKGGSPSSRDIVAVIPTEIVAKTIKVEFVTGPSTKHSFQNIVVMPAGEVVVLRIKSNPSMKMGEFLLHHGESEKLSLGVFTALRLQNQQPPDDLFGNK